MGHVLGAPAGTDGYLILEQLAAEGWEIAIVARGDREGLRAIATHRWVRVEAAGLSIAELAPFLLDSARRALATA